MHNTNIHYIRDADIACARGFETGWKGEEKTYNNEKNFKKMRAAFDCSVIQN